MALTACDTGEATSSQPPVEPAAGVEADRGAPEGPTGAPAATTDRGARAAEGAPNYAVIYPGGAIESDPVTSAAAGSEGGLVTYLTDADPETVIAFHRRQAEAAGLASIMAMNQGEARAYGAAKDQNNLQVVASPTPEGRTSVQLSWSAAR